MAHDKTPQQSLFSQVVVGVVVSVLTALILNALGFGEPGLQSLGRGALPPQAASSERIAFAAPEPKIELPPPETLLFNGRQTSTDPACRVLPESLRLPCPRRSGD
jgi:hypothetical protein